MRAKKKKIRKSADKAWLIQCNVSKFWNNCVHCHNRRHYHHYHCTAVCWVQRLNHCDCIQAYIDRFCTSPLCSCMTFKKSCDFILKFWLCFHFLCYFGAHVFFTLLLLFMSTVSIEWESRGRSKGLQMAINKKRLQSFLSRRMQNTTSRSTQNMQRFHQVSEVLVTHPLPLLMPCRVLNLVYIIIPPSASNLK